MSASLPNVYDHSPGMAIAIPPSFTSPGAFCTLTRMIVSGNIEEIRDEVQRARAGGARVGLVPTMGALHEAHLSLVRRAKRDGCFTVVSIYVNPAQFGPSEDFARYPRPIEKDLGLCEQEGVDLVFNPGTETMYPEGHRTWVSVEKITDGLCGAVRPGHFGGVATVVTKLFAIVLPDRAYFGRKDFQQLRVIERMTADLNFPVEVVGCPTVRDPDGVAMSSRNAYLGAEDRKRAGIIPAVLSQVARRWEAGVRTPEELMAGLREMLAAATDRIEYFGLYRPDTLEEVGAQTRLSFNPLVALAVRVGTTRLIDNLQPGVDPAPLAD
jgi:pantoate--beta-alanine ligase